MDLKLFRKAHSMGLRKYRQIIQMEYLTGRNGSRQLMVLSFARRNQILGAIDFISDKKTLKARLDCPLKADILPRITDKNKIAAVSIVNATVGESGEMPIIIRDPEKVRFSFASGDKNTEELRFEKTENENEYRVFMPSIPGWSVGTVFCD